MTGPARPGREDALRADTARLVQAMHHHLPAGHVPAELRALTEPVRQLAGLLDAGAPAQHLQEAALAVVDSEDWPRPDTISAGEGTVIDVAGDACRVEAPDRVLRMYGLLEAARDELDLTTVPPQDRARVQRLLEAVRAELERSGSAALADELHELIRHREAVPAAAELRIEYSSLLGRASGLVVAMLDQLAAARDKLYPMSQSSRNAPATDKTASAPPGFRQRPAC